MRRAGPLLIVKLGGSLAASGALAHWIAILAEAAAPIIVTPGGGPFADAVRAAQEPLGYSGLAAHHMALLAMAQMGIAIADAHPRFVVAENLQAMREALADGRIPVWAPAAMVLAAPIPATWDVTSDSLAAWLAGAAGAAELLLVKSVDVEEGARARDLAQRGIVDPPWPAFLRASGAAGRIAGPSAMRRAARDFAEGNIPGLPVAAD